MLKLVTTEANGKTLVCVILEPENIRRLQNGDPVFVNLEQLGIEGIDIIISAGDKQQVIDALRRAGIKIGEFREEGPHA